MTCMLPASYIDDGGTADLSSNEVGSQGDLDPYPPYDGGRPL